MRTRLAILVALSALVISVAAQAQPSRICRQLADMSRGGEAQDVRRDLREAIKAADNRQCFGFFFRKRDGSCRALIARIDRLEHALQRGTPRLSSRQLRQEMARHGCLARNPQTKADSRRSGPNGKAYRTVCVRKCDGYFFPLAYQRNNGGFNRDQKICHGVYGEGRAELYVFPTDGTIEDARSIGGEAYKDQSFPYQYPREFRPECQGQLHAGLSKVKESFLAATEKDRFSRFALIPIPIPRPSLSSVRDAAEPISISKPRVISRILEGFEPSSNGAPATVPGYSPPDLKDFRPILRASARDPGSSLLKSETN